MPRGGPVLPWTTTEPPQASAFLSLSWAAFHSSFQGEHRALGSCSHPWERGRRLKAKTLVKIILENSLRRRHTGLQHVPPVSEYIAVSSLAHQRKKTTLLSTNVCEGTWHAQCRRKERTALHVGKADPYLHFISNSLGHLLSPSGVTSKTSLTTEKIISQSE